MEVGFKTDKGVRRSNNEDACFVMKRDKLFVVADGVGGNNSGEIASRTAVTEITGYFQRNPLERGASADRIKEYFHLCINAANSAVVNKASRIPRNRGMATTIVAAYIDGNIAYILNVGDSRAYLLRDGTLVQITEDHTYVNTLIKAGLISEKDALTHENRNMITRAVGADVQVEADMFTVPVKKDDILLLCTDGLYGEVSEDEIIRILQTETVTGDMCNELVDAANRNGGSDNITMVVLKFTEEDINE